jgi:hypothetical protein
MATREAIRGTTALKDAAGLAASCRFNKFVLQIARKSFSEMRSRGAKKLKKQEN